MSIIATIYKHLENTLGCTIYRRTTRRCMCVARALGGGKLPALLPLLRCVLPAGAPLLTLNPRRTAPAAPTRAHGAAPVRPNRCDPAAPTRARWPAILGENRNGHSRVSMERRFVRGTNTPPFVTPWQFTTRPAARWATSQTCRAPRMPSLAQRHAWAHQAQTQTAARPSEEGASGL